MYIPPIHNTLSTLSTRAPCLVPWRLLEQLPWPTSPVDGLQTCGPTWTCPVSAVTTRHPGQQQRRLHSTTDCLVFYKVCHTSKTVAIIIYLFCLLENIRFVERERRSGRPYLAQLYSECLASPFVMFSYWLCGMNFFGYIDDNIMYIQIH